MAVVGRRAAERLTTTVTSADRGASLVLMGLELRTDEQLLRAARSDPDAFAAFYRRWERPVLAWMQRSCREPELAADLTAETFATALVHVRRGRPGTEPGWIWSIARSRLYDAHRRGKVADRARVRLGMQRLVVDDEAARIVEGLDLTAELARALDALDPAQREAVRARVLDDESYAEIATRLQLSPHAVRKRVSRGLATMRHNLEDPS